MSDGSAADLADALWVWGKSDLAAATVIDPPEGEACPTRIGVATPSGAASHAYRFGGDLRQVRVRATVMTLDRLRRALMTGAA